MLSAPGQFGDQGLAKRRQGNGVLRARHVADAELDSLKEWMRANIPPDFFAVIDAARLDQCLHIVVKIVQAGKTSGTPLRGKGRQTTAGRI